MSERNKALVQKFNAANAGFIALVEGLTDAQWAMPVGNEKRTVGIVAHHVADSHVATAGATTMLGNGQALAFTAEDFDKAAIEHIQKNGKVTKAEVLALLRQNGAASVGMISALSDAQLDTSAAVAFAGGQSMPAQGFAEMVWIGHIGDHTNNIKAAIGR